jgi:transposase
MHQERTQQFVGLDVHKDSICVAVSEGGPLSAARDLGRISHDVPRLLKLLARLGEPEDLHVAYEAGPTGYGLCRELRARGIHCVVVAPSKTPLPVGARIKTDRRDARLLAHHLRTHSLVPIDVPGEEIEALRDLVRLREDAVWALQKARQQLAGFLLRHSRVYSGKSHWTQPHLVWIRAQRFEVDVLRRVLDQYLAEVIRLKERLDQLSDEMVTTLEASPCASAYHYQQALRGVSTVVASTIVTELGDLRRFKTAGQFMSYVGLTPAEHSSGHDVRRGRITKAGNPHVRRVLIEAAWCARYRPARSHHMQLRLARVPLEIQDMAWKAQLRLHQRYRRMLMRGKSVQTTVVAIARELAGFVWAIGQVTPRPVS